MVRLTVHEVCKAVQGSLLAGDQNAKISDVAIDSRRARAGDCFFAIRGERLDGHDFIAQAVAHGAATLVISRTINIKDPSINVIFVDDTIKAYGRLAAYVRSLFEQRVVAVTGSVGKTSTCNMIATVCGLSSRVLSPEKNYNNHIGLPQTLLRLDDTYEVVVLEMGMSGLGEIAYLSRLARPDIAVIMNIGISHIGKLQTKQNILKAKMEIVEGLDPKSGLLLLNGDDGLLRGLKGIPRQKHLYFGTEEGNDYTAYNIQKVESGRVRYNVRLNHREYTVCLNVPGYHMVYNSLAALVVAENLGISPEQAIEGIYAYKPQKQRMNIQKVEDAILIDDTYNASPESFFAAISVLHDVANGRRKVAVIADMLEMGDYAEQAHRQVGYALMEYGVSVLFCMGEYAHAVAQGASSAGFLAENIHICKEHNELNGLLATVLQPEDAILVKGSRGMHMETCVDGIVETLKRRKQ